jgi:hypothetical protein
MPEAPARNWFQQVYTAAQPTCPKGHPLWVCQHRFRVIHRLDESIETTFRDTRCSCADCKLRHVRYRPVEESMLILPGCQYGLDVMTAIGSMRMRDDFSFPRIHERLNERGLPISLMGVQYQFRNYLSVLSCQATLKQGTLMAKLRKQGFILPVIDGLQFGEGDPVLYIIIDALSKQPLFGQEFKCRGSLELVPFIAQLKQLGLPILSVVSDKEVALVPAIAAALPGVPHQLCQLHYVKNAAKPMEEDLTTLGAEVRQTEEELRRFERTLIREQKNAEQTGAAESKELDIAIELTEAARNLARCHGRAPFDPPALKRHCGLQTVAQAAASAERKKGALGASSRS